MKFAKLNAAFVLTGLLAGLGTSAHATIVAPITYVFTAAQGQSTNFNGSTITIDGIGENGISSFDFFDNGAKFTSGSALSESITNYSSAGWDGSFTFAVGPEGEGFRAVGSADFGVGDSLSVTADPPGNWNAVVPGVPDAASTFELLLAGMGAIGVYHRNRTQAK
jgi:hypothetical protein